LNAAGSGRKTNIPLTEIILLVALIFALFPVGWLLWNSFKYHRDIVSVTNPLTFTLSNYMELFSTEFPKLFLNSLGLVFFSTVLCLLIASLAAYGLSKFPWPRSFTAIILGVAFFVQLMPPITLVPAFYAIANSLRLYNSVTILILVNTVFHLPFAIFLLKAYFDRVPTDLKEAALVDGCTELRAFWRIMLPLAAPGIGAVTILVSILSWNEFLMALTLTSTPDAQTMTVGIASFIQDFYIRYGLMCAAAGVATIPIIILATVAHRYIVAGLTGGALKE
jgi:ABC-type glycerol-3-phosphate transport system permease component